MVFKLAFKNIIKNKFRTAAIIITVALSCVLLFFSLIYNRLAVGQFMETRVIEAENADLRLAYTAGSSSRIITVNPLSDFQTEFVFVAGVLDLYGSATLNEEHIYINLRGATEQNIDRLNDLTYVAEQDRAMRKHELVISQETAEEYGLRLNSSVKITVGTKQKLFSVGKIAEHHPCFDTPGAVVMYGIESFISEYFWAGGFGRVYNKIFIKTLDGVNLDDLGKRITAIEEYEGYSVEETGKDEALKRNAQQISLPISIAAAGCLLLAVFLVYMIFSAGVKKRTELISRLKSIGARNSFITAIFMLECVIYIIFGAGLGYLCNNALFSQYLPKIISFDSADVFYRNMMLASSAASATVVFVVSLLPILKTRGVAVRTSFATAKNTVWKSNIYIFVLGVACLITAACLCIPYRLDGARGISALLLGIAGILFVAPYAARYLAKALQKLFNWGTAHLALKNVENERGLASTLRVLVAGMILCITISSAANITYNLSIQAVDDIDSDIVVENIRAQTDSSINTVKDIEGIYDVYAFSRKKIDIVLDGRKTYIYMIGISPDNLDFIKNTGNISSRDEIKNSLTEKKGLMLDVSYSKLYGVGVGDEIGVTMNGITKQIAVTGFYYSYLHVGRTGVMSNELMSELFEVPLFDSLVCKTTKDVEETVSMIRTSLGTYNVMAYNKSAAFAFYIGIIKTLVDFSNIFSLFIILVCIFGVIANILNSREERKTSFYQLYSMGVSRTRLFLCELIESMTVLLVALALVSVTLILYNYALVNTFAIGDLYAYRAIEIDIALKMSAVFGGLYLLLSINSFFTVDKKRLIGTLKVY
ncbi:MAG: hypothetical protein PHC84_05810 [Clostridia bacterium]|nr:hypothetical protein [Clostridia bacterium]